MRIGLHLQPQLRRTRVATPVLPESEKKLLQRGVAVLLLSQIDVLALGVGQERNVR